jgi:hypothetical protein
VAIATNWDAFFNFFQAFVYSTFIEKGGNIFFFIFFMVMEFDAS